MTRMTHFLIAAIFAVLCIAPAGAQETKSQLITEINTNILDNTSGAITPAIVRTTLIDMVNSWVDYLSCSGSGGIVYWSAGVPTCLTAGTNGQVLVVAGGVPVWSSSPVTAGAGISITGTTISLINPVAVTLGGTGFNLYAIGDILYADTTTSLARLADVATGNALLSGGAGVAPAWGKVSLSAAVTGNLPVGNLNSGTSASSATFWRGDGTWATPAGGGTVTSIVAGSGLSGGTITSTGTIALLFDPGSITNCTLVGTVSGNALTITLKQQDGSSDPSATAPCVVSFRSATAATGTYTAVLVTAATSFATGASGSTFGSTNSVPFRLWITAWNNAGTVVLGVSSQSTATTIYPLNEGGVASSTACNACTNASAAGTFYTTAAQTSKAFRILGYMDWSAGLATAGTWASGPTTIQMFGPGVKKPGEVVQTVRSATGAVATGTTVLPVDDTIPQNTEGNQYLTQAITPTSTVNLLDVSYQAMVAASAGPQIASALFQDSTVNALVASATENAGSNQPFILTGRYVAVASTISSTTFNVRAGPSSAATVTFNGVSGGRLFGGVNNSFIEIREIMG